MQKFLLLTRNIENGEALARQLAQKGASVKLVSDSVQAIDWMSQRRFDVFIADDGWSKEQYGELGIALWSADPTALAFVTGFEETLKEVPAYYKVLGFHPMNLRELREVLFEEAGPLPSQKPTSSSSEELKAQEDFPVLVVEDLDSPRDIICIFIESLGFTEVKGCASASEALSLLEEDPSHYRCIVTDLRMPKISGKELIEIIRSHDRLQHLPIVVLTAYGTLDMLVDCLRLGASGFLIKPPKKADMMRELSRAIRIDRKQEHPRLASHQEAEYIRKLVAEQKVT